jgi:hypothetical protein
MISRKRGRPRQHYRRVPLEEAISNFKGKVVKYAGARRKGTETEFQILFEDGSAIWCTTPGQLPIELVDNTLNISSSPLVKETKEQWLERALKRIKSSDQWPGWLTEAYETDSNERTHT